MTSESNTRTNEAPIDRDGGDMDDGAAARISASCDIAGEATPPLHIRLLEAGIPVVVCRPHVHYHDCRDDCDLELAPPRGWQKIDAEEVGRGEPHGRPRVKFVRIDEMLDTAVREAEAGAPAGGE